MSYDLKNVFYLGNSQEYAGGTAAGKEAKDVAIATAANLTGKEAKAVLSAAGKGTQFSDDIAKGLDKVAADDLGVKWIKDLNATGSAALYASDNLIATGTRAVEQSFKDAGVTIFRQDAKRIASDWAGELAEGKYVNDIAEWVSRGLVSQGRIPMKAGGFMSNYLCMAAQAMMMMGMHGHIAGKIQSLARGEDFDKI